MRTSANVSELDTRIEHEEARIAQNKEIDRGGSASVIQRSLRLLLSRTKHLRCAHNDASTNPIITGTCAWRIADFNGRSAIRHTHECCDRDREVFLSLNFQDSEAASEKEPVTTLLVSLRSRSVNRTCRPRLGGSGFEGTTPDFRRPQNRGSKAIAIIGGLHPSRLRF